MRPDTYLVEATGSAAILVGELAVKGSVGDVLAGCGAVLVVGSILTRWATRSRRGSDTASR